jgi:hypothetical protein
LTGTLFAPFQAIDPGKIAVFIKEERFFHPCWLSLVEPFQVGETQRLQLFMQ